MVCRVVGVGVLLLTFGCFSEPAGGAGGETGTTEAGTGTAPPTTGASASQTGSTGSTSVAEPTGFGTTEFGATGTSTGGCFDESFPGELADVDVVMVIDGSPAISDNAFAIQAMLDGWSDVFPRNLRHRLILMSPVEGALPQFCVPSPLGADVCGDSRFPHFTHLDVQTAVAGSDPLGVMTMQLNAGVAEVRSGSQKHLVVVTDGDISTTPVNAVNAVRGLGPGFANVRIHGVSGGDAVGCESSPALDAAAGISFGTSTELCPLQGAAELLSELLAPLASCVFNISDIDTEAVSGVTLSAGKMVLPLAQVESLVECGNDVSGAAITSIDGVQSLVLCPAVCALYQEESLRVVGGLTVNVCE